MEDLCLVCFLHKIIWVKTSADCIIFFLKHCCVLSLLHHNKHQYNSSSVLVNNREAVLEFFGHWFHDVWFVGVWLRGPAKIQLWHGRIHCVNTQRSNKPSWRPNFSLKDQILYWCACIDRFLKTLRVGSLQSFVDTPWLQSSHALKWKVVAKTKNNKTLG